MSEKIDIWRITNNPSSGVWIDIDINWVLNNIGQKLNDLVWAYKFYYLGLSSSEEKYCNFHQKVELNFVYAKSPSYQDIHKFAAKRLAENYTKDIMEIACYGLIELCQIINLMGNRNKGKKKEEIERDLLTQKKSLLKTPIPRLIEKIEKEVGTSNYHRHIVSINSLRNCLVHRGGVVDANELVLYSRTPNIFAINDFNKLDEVVETNKLNNLGIEFIEHERKWLQGENIEIGFADCLRMKCTAMCYFAEAINILFVKRFPELKISEPT